MRTQVSERSFQVLCDFKARSRNGPHLLRGRGSEPPQGRGYGSLNRNEKGAAFEFTKGRGFQDATLGSAFNVNSQVLLAAYLKDLVRSLNVKSALTIGDSSPPMFPEAAVHASALHWA